MAPSKKQRRIDVFDEAMSSSEESSSSSDTEFVDLGIIDVDFDVKIPEDTDFHGIRNLLNQLFLNTDINASEFTDLLIHQKRITGVIKKADEDDEEDDTDDLDDEDVTFGVFSVVNLTENKNLDCVKQITSYLLSHCKKSASDEHFQLLRSILENKEKHIGLIISERMLNIPPKIAVPLYSGLSYDIETAKANGECFNFDYYLLISKIVVLKERRQELNIIYSNAEEELIAEVASMTFDFSYTNEQEAFLKMKKNAENLPGKLKADNKKGHKKRRVMLFPASKFDEVCHKLATELGT